MGPLASFPLKDFRLLGVLGPWHLRFAGLFGSTGSGVGVGAEEVLLGVGVGVGGGFGLTEVLGFVEVLGCIVGGGFDSVDELELGFVVGGEGAFVEDEMEVGFSVEDETCFVVEAELDFVAEEVALAVLEFDEDLLLIGQESPGARF